MNRRLGIGILSICGVTASAIWLKHTNNPAWAASLSPVEESSAIPEVMIPTPVIRPDGMYNPTRSFAPLVKAIEPAVVAIEVESPAKAVDFQGIPPMFRDFFGADPRNSQPRHGEGSGFVISADGYVLTNNHVIENASKIEVRFTDGTVTEAKVVGSDPSIDVALLKLEGDRTWQMVTLGTSSGVEVGDWVLAVGNPLGLGTTVTAGIISGKGRALGHDVWDDFLQTDASINPGNSGGPLFDIDGKVIGINTAIIAGANTVGFAIPIDMVKDAVADLRDKGHISRGYLGVISEASDEKGAVVSQMSDDAPAKKAGLEIGDRIVAINGEIIDNPSMLVKRIGSQDPGNKVSLSIVREGKNKNVDIILGERPTQEALMGASKVQQQVVQGIKLRALTSDQASQLGVYSGVEILEMEKSSLGQGLLKTGDIILEINQWPVNSPEQVDELLQRSSGKALVLVQRDNVRKMVVIPIR